MAYVYHTHEQLLWIRGEEKTIVVIVGTIVFRGIMETRKRHQRAPYGRPYTADA